MKIHLLLGSVCLGLIACQANAAFLIQVDTDGADDGVLTFNSNFTFGGDTTTASQSIAAKAFGLTGGDSIFGGNGVVELDIYVYRYDPTSDADNLVTTGIELGVDLVGNPVFGSGVVGGSVGLYRVYAAWPATSNVSGGLTRYTVTSGANSFFVDVDQNTANDPDLDDANDVWVYLGNIAYDGSSGIIATQQAGSNTFTSMRAAAVMFEPVPEPSSIVICAMAFVSWMVCHRPKH